MSFEKLLFPASVAVVGASADPGKAGHSVLNNIISGGYGGAIYPVNPKAGEILGKKCYASLSKISGDVDCAVIAVKRDQVLPVLQECVEKAVKAVIIISAGFAETGEEGKRLQQEIAQTARRAQITLLGPNCLGVINPAHGLNASFGQAMGRPGSIAFVSQSGALITAIQDIAADVGTDFSLLISMGNKAALDEVAVFENLKGHGDTKVIPRRTWRTFRAARTSCASRSEWEKSSRSSSSRPAGPRRAHAQRHHIPEALRAPTRPMTAPSSARA